MRQAPSTHVHRDQQSLADPPPLKHRGQLPGHTSTDGTLRVTCCVCLEVPGSPPEDLTGCPGHSPPRGPDDKSAEVQGLRQAAQSTLGLLTHREGGAHTQSCSSWSCPGSCVVSANIAQGCWKQPCRTAHTTFSPDMQPAQLYPVSSHTASCLWLCLSHAGQGEAGCMLEKHDTGQQEPEGQPDTQAAPRGRASLTLDRLTAAGAPRPARWR